MCRLTLACGGNAMNSVDELTPECLGFAGVVYEHVLVSCVCDVCFHGALVMWEAIEVCRRNEYLV